MSILFEAIKLGSLQIKNRFVHSATYEGMATETGEVTDDIVNRYRRLAKGDVGLVIPGGLYVHHLGRTSIYQTGIHTHDTIPGLKRVVEAIHQEGSSVVFQLMHAGGQTKKEVIGRVPMSPSATVRDPVRFRRPKKMTQVQIDEVIQAFGKAAQRAIEAGADGVQLHAAHGYLINQFLSPFYNDRSDKWGGSDENRFRFLREVILEIKKDLPEGMPLLVKLNVHDYTPKKGITPALAVEYAKWLAELEIDGLELSCGTAFSYMNMCRGEVPVDELLRSLPRWQKPMGKLTLNRMVGKYGFQGGYNLDAAKMIKPICGNAKLLLVGGLRSVAQMEEIVENGYADFISMSRPLIREPYFVKRIKQGETDAASCVSCNKCLAAMVNDIPVRCYYGRFPK